MATDMTDKKSKSKLKREINRVFDQIKNQPKKIGKKTLSMLAKKHLSESENLKELDEKFLEDCFYCFVNQIESDNKKLQKIAIDLVARLVKEDAHSGQVFPYSQEKASNFLDMFVADFLRNSSFLSVFYGDRTLTLDKSASFSKEKKFLEAYSHNPGANGCVDRVQADSWRLHTLTWAAMETLHLEGDFVECGTYLGDFALTICKYLQFEKVNKKFYLYDSFDGLDPNNSSSEDYHLKASGTFNFLNKYYEETSSYEIVKSRFESYDNVVITKGFLPQTLEEQCPDKICFLHIDLNSPKPELGCIKKLYDRLVPGAIVIYDDYGWKVFEKQKEVADLFAESKGYRILELPTGQGLFIKK